MKTKIYILLIIIISLCSCSDNGPYTLGKLEYTTDVSNVSSITALVSVTIPQNKDNMLECLWGDGIFLEGGSHEREWGNYIDNLSTKERKIYFFYSLNPNTTYNIKFDYRIRFNGINSEFENSCFDACDSFTTAPEGDYSGIGEFRCELVEYDYSSGDGHAHETLIKLCPPGNVTLLGDPYLYACSSTYPDKLIRGYNLHKSELNNKYNIQDNEILYEFPVLEMGIYSFMIKEKVIFDFFDNYSVDIKFSEDNPLKISNILDLSDK